MATTTRTDLIRTRPDHARTLAGLSIGQVLTWQCAALAALAGWPGPPWLTATTTALLVVVSVAVVGRFRSRWWYVWAEVAARYRRRAGATGETGVAGVVGSELVVESFVDRVGTRFGLIQDDGAWTAVLVVEPAHQSALSDDLGQSVPLGPLGDALVDRDIRLTAVQLVSHVVPAPSPWIDPRSPVVASYREVAGEQVVANRSVWVALRLDPARCPGAVAARGGGDLGVHRALASVAARLAATLDQHARVRVLGPDEVRAAVTVTLAAGDAPMVERWREVAGPGRTQVGFRVRSWGRGDPTGLIPLLAAVPSLATTASLVLSPAKDDQVAARLSLRLVSLPPDAGAVEAAVHRVAGAVGARVVRSDGEHAIAVRDALPTGGAR